MQRHHSVWVKFSFPMLWLGVTHSEAERSPVE